jgi:hypothetical protein
MRALVVFFALSCSGCAGGLAWVSAVDQSAIDHSSLSSASAPPLATHGGVEPGSAESAGGFLEPPAPARPRLAQTVTLGEIELADAPESASGSPGSAAPARGEQSVIVYVQSPGAVFYDPSYRRHVSARSFRHSQRSNRRATVRPHASSERETKGPHYGPAFPFKAAPAPPW